MKVRKKPISALHCRLLELIGNLHYLIVAFLFFTDIPPGVALSDLSPSRLAVREEKQTKVSAIQCVGEQMLRQSAKEHKEMMEASQREHSQLLQVLNTAQDREDATNQSILGLFREALGTLSEMSRSMSVSRERREMEAQREALCMKMSQYNTWQETLPET